MFKRIIIFSLIVLFTSCEYVLKNKDEILSLQKKSITYDDFSTQFDSFNQTVYLDKENQRMNGHFIVSYKDKIAEEFEVKTGLLNGFHKNYYPEGIISKEKNYKNGKLNGESVFYTKEGKIYSKSTYINGNLSGEEIGYDEMENVISVRKFVDKIEYHHIYRDGKMVGSEFKKNIDGTVYDLMVRYDGFENISMIIGLRDYEPNSKMFYVFDRNFKLIEAVNAEKEPSKVRYYFGTLNIPKN